MRQPPPKVDSAVDGVSGPKTGPKSAPPALHFAGLVDAQDHSCPKAVLALGGSLFRLHFPAPAATAPIGGRRGIISDFTPAARRRLLDLCQSIDTRDLPAPPLFITLTYPQEYPHEREIYKGHLDTWCKRLLRFAPEVSCIWRLEWQKRGAPHYHLLAFGRAFIDKDWVATSWYEVVGSSQRVHLLAGTEIRAVRSWHGVLHYAAKYMAKPVDQDAPKYQGRYWGVHNRATLPVHLCTVPLDEAAFWAARRVVYHYYRSRGKVIRYKSLRRGVSVYFAWQNGAAILSNLVTLDPVTGV